MKNRVVITGLGCVTSIGDDLDEIKKNMRDLKCGISEIESFDTSNFEVKLAGEVKNLKTSKYLEKKEIRRLDRVDIFGLIAAAKSLEDSGLNLRDVKTDKISVLVSSGIGGLKTIETQHIRGLDKGFERISPFFIPMAISNTTASHIASKYGIHGSCICPVTACAGSATAIGEGFRQIKDGYAEMAIVGGAEASITELGIGGFSSMRALSKSKQVDRASIPFDKERDGFVMGEGGGILVLESLDSAVKRGAKIYAEVLGYGSTCDAGHITQPNEDGIFAARAMENAMQEAGIGPDMVDYINAHGTSTELNDSCETKAIRRVFKDLADKVLVSSTKSATGHLLGASGAVETILTLLAIEEGIVPVNLNYRTKDEECSLNIVTRVLDRKIDCFISNSLGFGGHNVSLVYRRWDEDEI